MTSGTRPRIYEPPEEEKPLVIPELHARSGGKHRRHLIGYDDAIRPTFEFAVNPYRNKHGDPALITKLRALNQAAQMKCIPNATTRPLKDHLKYSLAQLNSSPGNLNPELASENQAIEVVRQQAQGARKKLV